MGTVAAPGGFAERAGGFLTGAVRGATLLVGLTSFTGRREVMPGLDPNMDSVLDKGSFFVAFAADLGFAAAVLPLTVEAVFGGSAAVGCSGGGGEVCSEESSGGFEGSATAAASVVSVFSMVTPSGFIPCHLLFY